MNPSPYWIFVEDSQKNLKENERQLQAFRGLLRKYRHNREITRNCKEAINHLIDLINQDKRSIEEYTKKAKEDNQP